MEPWELDMSNVLERGNAASETAVVSTVDLKLEVVAIPVEDVERAKRFYGGLGWRLDADFPVGDDFRVVQFTPPGSPTSIHFGIGITTSAPGSAKGLYLVVSDIEATRADLVKRGAQVSEIYHRTGPGQPAINGRDPERRSYRSYATFSDPDGNGWLLQEIVQRLPGRVDGGARLSQQQTISRALSVVLRLRMESTRNAPASTTKTGQTGMPLTWWRSRTERSCRPNAQRPRRHGLTSECALAPVAVRSKARHDKNCV
jgi:catechol 2,3-dioxygenase-like lactoylglutathione lyase family enzyme